MKKGYPFWCPTCGVARDQETWEYPHVAWCPLRRRGEGKPRQPLPATDVIKVAPLGCIAHNWPGDPLTCPGCGEIADYDGGE